MILLLLTCILFIGYSLLLFRFRQSWEQLALFQPGHPASTRISVIIPARNEEHNIGPLLLALQQQSYPAAFTEVKDEKDRVLSLKIYDVSVEETKISEPSGVLLTDNKTYLKFTASDGYVQVHRLQLAGKKTMDVQDLLRGTHLKSVE